MSDNGYSVESPTGVPPWGGRPQTFSRSYFCSEGFPSRASSPRHSKPVEWRSRRRLFFLRPTHPPAKRRDLVSVSCPVSDVGLDLRSCAFSELRPYGVTSDLSHIAHAPHHGAWSHAWQSQGSESQGSDSRVARTVVCEKSVRSMTGVKSDNGQLSSVLLLGDPVTVRVPLSNHRPSHNESDGRQPSPAFAQLHALMSQGLTDSRAIVARAVMSHVLRRPRARRRVSACPQQGEDWHGMSTHACDRSEWLLRCEQRSAWRLGWRQERWSACSRRGARSSSRSNDWCGTRAHAGKGAMRAGVSASIDGWSDARSDDRRCAIAHAGDCIDGWHGAARHVRACWQQAQWATWAGAS